jgi:hypothetical protein
MHEIIVYTEFNSFTALKLTGLILCHVKWVPCHHGMASPQVSDGGEDLQIRRVAANILNKQLRAADKRWPSSFGVGHRANNSSPCKIILVRNVTTDLGLGQIFG